jgi:hypothetical protein
MLRVLWIAEPVHDETGYFSAVISKQSVEAVDWLALTLKVE